MEQKRRRHFPLEAKLITLYRAEKKGGFKNVGKPIDYKTYRKIFNLFGEHLYKRLSEGLSISLPYFGNVTPMIKTTKRSCDVNKTMSLWEKDEEAKEQRFIVYHHSCDKVFFDFQKRRGLKNAHYIEFSAGYTLKRFLASNKNCVGFRKENNK